MKKYGLMILGMIPSTGRHKISRLSGNEAGHPLTSLHLFPNRIPYFPKLLFFRKPFRFHSYSFLPHKNG